MSIRQAPPVDALIERLDQAVGLNDVERITARIKHDLEELSRTSSISLPEEFCQPGPSCYARRLLHRDPELGYTVVVMSWGPGQQTPLHDHAGIWCVECVFRGQLEVIQYELQEQSEGRFRFDRKGTLRAGVGEAGRLIPPYEYHVLGNAMADETTVTVHVYGGEMDHCHSYAPGAGGWWDRHYRPLEYSN